MEGNIGQTQQNWSCFDKTEKRKRKAKDHKVKNDKIRNGRLSRYYFSNRTVPMVPVIWAVV